MKIVGKLTNEIHTLACCCKNTTRMAPSLISITSATIAMVSSIIIVII
jgi:hypothetical protein